MSLNIVKGQTPSGGLSLTKEAPGVTKFFASIGWDQNPNQAGPAYDLDIASFSLDANGKLFNNDPNFVCYFNNPNKTTGDYAVTLDGDNRSGDGDGNDETITIDTSKVDPNINEISIVATIYNAQSLGLNFGVVKNAFMKICDDRGREILRVNLDSTFANATGVQFGSLIRDGSGWKFEDVGSGGVADLNTFYGMYTS